MISNGG